MILILLEIFSQSVYALVLLMVTPIVWLADPRGPSLMHDEWARWRMTNLRIRDDWNRWRL